MTTPIIEMEQLTKVYDGKAAVDQLSLSIKKGEIFGLLGPNGAGKSTTILMLLGLIEPTDGKVNVCGFNSMTHPIDVKKRVGYLPDNLGFYQHMTGLENLMYTAALNGINRQDAENRAYSLLEQVGISDAAHKKAGKYSRGMKQRLGLADVLIKDPDVIILDEPTLGIDPEGVREILKLIKQLNVEKQLTILLSSHHLHQVQAVCDRVGIFVNGKLLACGSIDQLATQLLDGDPFIVHVEADPLDETLIAQISAINGVNHVKKVSEQKVDIYCERNMAPNIAETVVSYGSHLGHLSQKNYGLDEIYHRYFEGRDIRETA